MHSVIFSIGPVTVYGYGLMLAIGVILAVSVACSRAKTHGLSYDLMFNAAFFGVLFGLLGAKVMYWIVELDEIIKNPRMLLDLSGGLVVYGGLIIGILTPYIYLKKIKKTVCLPYLEVAIASIPLGQGFGRIGCFLGGCCYGAPAPEGAWYAVHFPEGSLAPAGVGLIPTQLMSAGFDFLLFFLLLFLTNREKFMGQMLSLYALIYSVGRFTIEFLRNDPRGNVGTLSTSQFIAIGTFALGIALYVLFSKLHYEPFRKISKEEIKLKEAEFKAAAKKQ